eukprot:TRINITY_DN41023_c0_g1_i1.p1 TRINITY_DN41023_c0_g1~~TRINITY_DN41023_c0_g1_i1.p1  ORF type:complete len:735 (+),score=138.27 TRINITY_DN41023_c0_g1_i1:33-2237(+)
MPSLVSKADVLLAFRKYDMDGDGLMDPKELQRLLEDLVPKDSVRRDFQLLDAGGNGRVHIEELKMALQSLDATTFSDANCEALFDEMDTNSDSTIDYNEFIDWVARKGESSFFTDEQIMALKATMKPEVDFNMSEAESLMSVFTAADKNKDGKLQVEEFIGWIFKGADSTDLATQLARHIRFALLRNRSVPWSNIDEFTAEEEQRLATKEADWLAAEEGIYKWVTEHERERVRDDWLKTQAWAAEVAVDSKRCAQELGDAAWRCNLDKVVALLDARAAPDSVSTSGTMTPLHRLAYLECGGWWSQTACMGLCSEAHSRDYMIRALCKARANIDFIGDYSMTPLNVALSGGYASTARSFLELGADPAMKGSSGRDALGEAEHKDPMFDLEKEDSFGGGKGEMTLVLKAFLELKDPPMNLRRWPLAWAKQKVADTDDKGGKVLYCFASVGSSDFVRALIVASADVSWRHAASGRTALHACCNSFAKVDAVRSLCRVPGVAVNAQDDNGFTPLWLAAGCGNLEVSRILLEFGADPNIKRRDHKNYNAATPVEFAMERQHHATEALLRASTSSVPPGVSVEVLQWAFEEMAKKDNDSRCGGQFLAAVEDGNTEQVLALIAARACVNRCRPYGSGEQPLHYAAQTEDDRSIMIRAILAVPEKGCGYCFVDIQDNYHETPLFKAAMYNNLENVRTLLELKADPSIVSTRKQHRNRTPLHLADINKNDAMAKLLREAAVAG